MSGLPRQSVLTLAVASMLVAAFVVLGKCAYDRRMRRIDSEAMRLGAEDAARRLSENRVSLAGIKELYEESALAAAKSLAAIVAGDPSVLEDRARFEALAETVGVDEIHVSDGKGVLIASLPADYAGYRMDSQSQSAEFMPAITNRAFALVQKAQPKGIDGKYFQYAGVARLDSPGIVQVGLRPGRLEYANSLADYRQIAATTRVGRGGSVQISILDEADRIGGARSRTTVEERDGGRFISLHTDCGSYRIVVTMPYRGWRLADDRPYRFLGVFLISLLVLILLGGLNMFGSVGLRRTLAELKAVVRSVNLRGNGRRMSPVVVISLAVFLLGVVIAWLVSEWAYRRYAREVMLNGIGDFTEDFETAPDGCLFFVGNAITTHYRTPRNAMKIDIRELMCRYGIDELNVVDADGIVLRGDLASEGFDFHSNTNSAKFLRLLTNEYAYAQSFRAAIEDPSIVRKYAGVAFPRHNGFVQIGFDEKRIAEDFDYRLSSLAQDWSIGTDGYCVLARNDGRIVSSGHPDFKRRFARGEISTLSGVGFDASLIPPDDDSGGGFFEAMLYDESCLCVSRRLGGFHRLIVATPISAIEKSRNASVLFVAVMLIVLLGVLTVAGTHLSNLVAQLRRFIAEDTRRRAEELRNAKAIQTESLPTGFPDEPDYRIYARMDTAKEVGGDFYDFYTLPSGRQLFLIADTSGKGIPAAMFMMKAKAVIRAGLFEAADFAAAVTEANERLAESNDANMFVTAWIGIFDPTDGKVEFVNCGHNPPLVKHADGSVSWVRTRPNLALAAMPNLRARVETITLKRGESLFIYTDGVTEAMNAAGEQYGEKRLEADLAVAPGGSFVEAIRAKVAAFVAGAEQSDDITMLSLDYKGL